MAEVASNLLNYTPENTRRRAVSSRGYRTLTPASNGSSFTASQTINIDLPGNVQNTFFDFGSSYLKLRLTNNDGAALKLEGGCGIYGMIKKIEIVTGGNVISTIDEYGVLVDKFLSSDAANQFKNNTGAVLAGTNGAGPQTGTSIGAAASRSFAIPLVLTPLFNLNRYCPAFSRDQIRIRITLNSAVAGLMSAAAADPTDAQIVIDNVEFNCYMVELSNSAMNMVNESVNGMYNLVVDDYRHAAATLANGSTTLNAVLGFSFSSLNRVIVIHRPQDTINARAPPSIGNRGTARLQEINVLVNGEQYPQRPIKELGTASTDGNGSGGSEALAEALVAERSMGYFGHDSSTGTPVQFALSNGDGTSNAKTGSYFVSVDLEAMRSEDSDKLFSGVDSLGAVVSVNSKYNTAPEAFRVDCYAEYTMSMMLDMNGTGTFSVAL